MTGLIAFLAWLAFIPLVLAFLAGAKKTSMTPAEIEAEYDQQYLDLQRNLAR